MFGISWKTENSMPRPPLLMAMIALLFTATLGVASAQSDATPFAGRETPDPALCTVAPRSIAAMTPAAATPGAGSATPAAASEPVGQPVSAQTETEITAAVRELYACLNGGDSARTLALFTDAAAARFVADRPDLAPSDRAATPTPLALDQRIALVAIADIRLLPDGRVFALVTQDDPNRPPNGPEPVFLTFTKQGGGWLVDDLRVLASGA
jgi:hypothetical protein